MLAASFPDQLFSPCFDIISMHSLDTVSNGASGDHTIEDLSKKSADHQGEECDCPVHSHHCCSHIAFVNVQSFTKIIIFQDISVSKTLYVNQILSEPFLDSLYRPPKV